MIAKEELKKLYAAGNSMKEIAELLSCSHNRVVYWMQKHKIRRRSRSEATYIKANPEGDPYRIKTNLTKSEDALLYLALGIYWGEGTKANKHSLRVSNTDAKMIRCFRKFLLQICQVRPEKIKYSIVCFNDTPTNVARNHWAKELLISPEKFGKITWIPAQGKGTYKKKSKFGVCTISVSNFKLKKWMLSKLDETAKMPD